MKDIQLPPGIATAVSNAITEADTLRAQLAAKERLVRDLLNEYATLAKISMADYVFNRGTLSLVERNTQE